MCESLEDALDAWEPCGPYRWDQHHRCGCDLGHCAQQSSNGDLEPCWKKPKGMGAGRFGLARRRLTELVARRPGWGEALYQLGVCEQARNRPDAAVEMFERVPPDSEWIGLERRAAIAAGDGSRPIRRVRETAQTGRRAAPGRTSPRLAGAWCFCSAWRDASRKPIAGSKTALTR